jgi:hypothetical protein
MQKRKSENGMSNDLPMATRDALEVHEDVMNRPMSANDMFSVLEGLTIGLSNENEARKKEIESLETKFRTLQTRCNNVLARQSQIDSLLNELKIGMPKKAIKKK